jgi:hypothetical protein
MKDVDVELARVRAEFNEMPGMTLTVVQAARLFGLEHDVCRTVLDRLVRSAYLRWTPGGSLTRAA